MEIVARNGNCQINHLCFHPPFHLYSVIQSVSTYARIEVSSDRRQIMFFKFAFTQKGRSVLKLLHFKLNHFKAKCVLFAVNQHLL